MAAGGRGTSSGGNPSQNSGRERGAGKNAPRGPSSRAGARGAFEAAEGPGGPRGHAAPEARPLKPRPVLLAVMAAVFAAWMACLVLMYVKTVYPAHRVSPKGGDKAAVYRGVPVGGGQSISWTAAPRSELGAAARAASRAALKRAGEPRQSAA